MAHNAKKGGEIGANGEFYKGGQFVADSEETVKGERKRKPCGTRKIQIEPYKWVEAEPNDRSLFRLLPGLPIKWLNWERTKVAIDESIIGRFCSFTGRSVASIEEYVRLYNSGVRIIKYEEMKRIDNLK